MHLRQVCLTLCAGLWLVPAIAQPSHHNHESMKQVQETTDNTAEEKSSSTNYAHDHGSDQGSQTAMPPFIQPVTDEARAAAFPDVMGHAVHDQAIQSFTLIDQLEWQDADEGSAFNWNAKGWIGQDLSRLWWSTEGERENGSTEDAQAQLLYGRSIARWWDLVAGLRHDFKPGSSQTWAAVGFQGLSPYWFELEATLYLGEAGQTAARLEAEYDVLLTNRLILQPLIEVNAYGKDDAERETGSGLSSIEAGLRLRYEFTRKVAPYLGVSWARKFGNTLDYAREDGEGAHETRLVIGIRTWF